MALRVVTPPDLYPVTLQEAKQQLRVESDDDDDFITGLIAAATVHAQNITQRRFCQQTLEWVRNEWPDRLRLPVAPVQSVTFVNYVDAFGNLQTMDPSLYIVRNSGATKEIVSSASYWFGWDPLGFVPGPLLPWPWPLLGPAAEPIVVRFIAGAVDNDTTNPIPPNVGIAIRLMVAHWYRSREAVSAGQQVEIPFGINALLEAERWE